MCTVALSLFLGTMWKQGRYFISQAHCPFILPQEWAPKKPRNFVGILIDFNFKELCKNPSFQAYSWRNPFYKVLQEFKVGALVIACNLQYLPFWLQKHHKHFMYWKCLFGGKRWQLLFEKRTNVCKNLEVRERNREIQWKTEENPNCWMQTSGREWEEMKLGGRKGRDHEGIGVW